MVLRRSQLAQDRKRLPNHCPLFAQVAFPSVLDTFKDMPFGWLPNRLLLEWPDFNSMGIAMKKLIAMLVLVGLSLR